MNIFRNHIMEKTVKVNSNICFKVGRVTICLVTKKKIENDAVTLQFKAAGHRF